MNDAKNTYNKWLSFVDRLDETTKKELYEMKTCDNLIEDAFSNDLKFGTSGIRGIMGAGTNRINPVMVSKVSQGISNYLLKNFDKPAVCIGYDTRMNAKTYAEYAAMVYCANHIPVYMFDRTVPVSLLSSVIPKLGLSIGVMVTASHNRKEYNGYKVYGPAGYQITGEMPENMLSEIESIDEFQDTCIINLEAAKDRGLLHIVPEELIREFLDDIIRCGRPIERDLSIVYTPLNGAGLEFVSDVLHRKGINNIYITETQKIQDGQFATCSYPNPEKIESYSESIKLANKLNIDHIIATDPDCDRFGIAERIGNQFHVLTGNEIGILMFVYLCETRSIKAGDKAYRSIVSSPLIDVIAKHYHLQVETTLIGFKYIGEKLCALEDKSSFFFGFEESHGYLIDGYTYDKDGVGACSIACEMIDYYGSLILKLEEIYQTFGYIENRATEYEDSSYGWRKRLDRIMNQLREIDIPFDSYDYLKEGTGLPKSNILRFTKDSFTIYIRPSGTEPKIKIYVFVIGETKMIASEVADDLSDYFTNLINKLSNIGE